MGALRKSSPAVVQPTQIIVFPIDQARPDLVEKPSAWERFEDSEAGSLILFELRAFGLTFLAAATIGLAFYGGYSAKNSMGIDLSDNMSLTMAQQSITKSDWKPSHYLN